MATNVQVLKKNLWLSFGGAGVNMQDLLVKGAAPRHSCAQTGALTMDMLCDRHPLQKMLRVQVRRREPEPKQDADGFKCPECNRVYILAGNLGYLDYANSQLIPNSRQLLCPQHISPLYLAAFQFNVDASFRIWRCAHPGCKEERSTIGEDYLVEHSGTPTAV